MKTILNIIMKPLRWYYTNYMQLVNDRYGHYFY